MAYEFILKATCYDCFYFWPYHLVPTFGVCGNRSSPHHGLITEASREPCADFQSRLSRLLAKEAETPDFLWCKTCRESFYKSELEAHQSQEVFCGVALHEAEENAKLTLAGD